MKKINLEVITPDKQVIKEPADFVLIPSKDGQMEVLPGHARFIGQLLKGRLRFDESGKCHYVNVGSGVFEVSSDTVRVLTAWAQAAHPAT